MEKIAVFSRKTNSIISPFASNVLMAESSNDSWSNGSGSWNNNSYESWVDNGWNNNSLDSWQNKGWNNSSLDSWKNTGRYSSQNPPHLQGTRHCRAPPEALRAPPSTVMK